MHKGRDDQVGSELNVYARDVLGRLARRPFAVGCFLEGEGVVMAEAERAGIKVAPSIYQQRKLP